MDERLNEMTSKPADSSCLSFLDLPAEIRNHIYAEIYEHVDHIVLTRNPAGDDLVTLHRRVYDRNHALPWRTGTIVGEQIEMPYRQNDTLPAFQEGLSLFLTCRQISNEAASVFYSNNVFRMAVKRNLGLCPYIHEECQPGSRMLDKWLEQIGAKRMLVKKVCLDLDSICQVHCKNNESHIEWVQGNRPSPIPNGDYFAVLPLLNIIWKHSLQLKVSVERSKQARSRFTYNRHYPYSPFKAMSTALQSFCRDDLDVAKFQRTLACIAIKNDGSGGDMVSRTTTEHDHVQENSSGIAVPERSRGLPDLWGHGCIDTAKGFSLGEGDRLHWDQDDSPIKLSKLPRYIYHGVLKRVIKDGAAKTLDLDNLEGSVLWPEPVYVNRELRREFSWHMLYRFNMLAVCSTSRRARFSGKSMSRMERYLRHSITYTYTPLLERRTSQWSPGLDGSQPHFKLSVKLDGALTMEELRIAILPFVIASSQTWNDRCVTFTLDTPGSKKQAVTIEMDLLRRRVLLALKGYFKEHGNGTEMCPELWINGHGRVMEVVRKDATSRAVVQDSAVVPARAAKQSSAPPYPTDGKLDSTISYLAWYKRSWQKLK
ncbi:hypothetical protein HBI32_185790 [Parastagonospora nodorum]|nr:hypothetical protein HBI32_185790 [Parastagonospora nodorum]